MNDIKIISQYKRSVHSDKNDHTKKSKFFLRKMRKSGSQTKVAVHSGKNINSQRVESSSDQEQFIF